MGIRDGEEYTAAFHDTFIELIFKTTQIGDFDLKSNYWFMQIYMWKNVHHRKELEAAYNY